MWSLTHEGGAFAKKKCGLCGLVQVSSQAQVTEITREEPALGGKTQSFVLQGDARAWLCKGQQFLWRKEDPLCTGQSLHVPTWSAHGNGC